MKKKDLARVEVFIFVAEDPVSLKTIADAVDLSNKKARKCLEKIKKIYESNEHGITLKEYNESFIFKTKNELAPFIKKYYEKEREVKLSKAALETLAIIAYRQPVTRAEIEEIRGVKAEKTLITLGKYDLIEELGRKETIGNPIVYGTTEEFLEHIDISDLSKLPELEEVD